MWKKPGITVLECMIVGWLGVITGYLPVPINRKEKRKKQLIYIYWYHGVGGMRNLFFLCFLGLLLRYTDSNAFLYTTLGAAIKRWSATNSYRALLDTFFFFFFFHIYYIQVRHLSISLVHSAWKASHVKLGPFFRQHAVLVKRKTPSTSPFFGSRVHMPPYNNIVPSHPKDRKNWKIDGHSQMLYKPPISRPSPLHVCTGLGKKSCNIHREVEK